MKIKSDKHVWIQLSWLITFGIIFLGFFCYFLGWEFKISTFAIATGIITALLSVLWLVCLIIVKCETKYYVINKEGITLWRENEILYELKSSEIIDMVYVGFIWIFMMQMGSGYLHITCRIEALPDKKYATFIKPNGIAIPTIAMSKKQAKQCAKILGIQLKPYI